MISRNQKKWKRAESWLDNKRLESVGDRIWKLVVAEKIFHEKLARSLEPVWNSNQFMTACARQIADLKKASGGEFEKFIAEIYLEKGIAPIRELCSLFCVATVAPELAEKVCINRD
jgi:hypothetical protein